MQYLLLASWTMALPVNLLSAPGALDTTWSPCCVYSRSNRPRLVRPVREFVISCGPSRDLGCRTNRTDTSAVCRPRDDVSVVPDVFYVTLLDVSDECPPSHVINSSA